jgi:cyclopropane fatty-acyl-phospholipid synthase-like methyltransferase
MPDELIRQLMLDAGLREGMRVLDIGCGRGDVTFMAAELVGARGQALGIDRNIAAVEAGRARAHDLGVANVGFKQTDLSTLAREHGAFDAVVGRRVLMYQPDAVACLSLLGDVLVAGGLIVLQEHDSTSMPICSSPMPLHEQVSRWIWETVAREGANVHMGLGLERALTEAGFTVERVRAEATVLTPAQSHPIGAIVRAMLERMEQAGVATAADVDADTLDQRLAAERREAGGACIWEMVFGAWARNGRP